MPAPADHDLRYRVSALLEQGYLPNSARVARLIVLAIVVNVVVMVLSSVPELDARLGTLFDAVEGAAIALFALDYAARLWSAPSHATRSDMTPWQARLDYATGIFGIIDLLAVGPPLVAHFGGDHAILVLLGMLPFLKLARYSTAMRSLFAAVHAERRALFGCLVILTGAVLTFAALLYAIEHKVQPEKFGTIPSAMWWAIVTLGTVGYGDVVPMTPLGKAVAACAIVGGLMMIALPVAIIASAFANEIRRRDFIVTWGMLARVPLFSHLDAAGIADIMRLLRAQTLETGDILVRRGEPAASMYFITSGEVEIELPTQRVRLSDGAFFGEIALLRRTNRSGTVIATRKTHLLALDARDFHSLMERSPVIAKRIEETARDRLADTQGAAKGDLAAEELSAAEPDAG